jgi:hypothetical protein
MERESTERKEERGRKREEVETNTIEGESE